MKIIPCKLFQCEICKSKYFTKKDAKQDESKCKKAAVRKLCKHKNKAAVQFYSCPDCGVTFQ